MPSLHGYFKSIVRLTVLSKIGPSRLTFPDGAGAGYGGNSQVAGTSELGCIGRRRHSVLKCCRTDLCHETRQRESAHCSGNEEKVQQGDGKGVLVRHIGSNILDILYPPRVTRERYRAVIGRLNGRIRDLRSEIRRLEVVVARVPGGAVTERGAGSMMAILPANDNGRMRSAISTDRR